MTGTICWRRLIVAVPLSLVAVVQFSGCTGRSSVATEPAALPASLTRKPTVQIAIVQTSQLTSHAEFTGNLLPRRRTSIVAEIDGIVQDIAELGPLFEIDVDGKHYSEQLGILPGQYVQAGEILMQLERTNFELNVALAEAKLAKAKADLAKLNAWERPEAIKRLEALRDEYQARYNLAKAEFERKESLSSSKAVSRSELERASMEVQATEATLISHQAVLGQANAGPTVEDMAVQEALVKQAEVELQQEERFLEKTTIRAPYDGVITEVRVEEGDHVSPSSGSLFELLDLRYLVAEVGVPESYLGKVQQRDIASVSIAGSIDPVPGVVVGINDKVDPESRSFRVRVAIDNSDRRFKAGQFARVSMSLGSSQGTVVIPSGTITYVEGQPGVFIYDDGIARRRAVTLGNSDDMSSEVLSGIKPGDSIVVDDPTMLTDGLEVDIRTNDS